jgi:hypothetical protein
VVKNEVKADVARMFITQVGQLFGGKLRPQFDLVRLKNVAYGKNAFESEYSDRSQSSGDRK